MLGDAVRMRANDAPTFFNLALAERRLGKNQQALGHYEKAYQLNPADESYKVAYEAMKQSLGLRHGDAAIKIPRLYIQVNRYNAGASGGSSARRNKPACRKTISQARRASTIWGSNCCPRPLVMMPRASSCEKAGL